ncbi:MAG: DNA alkylation repair protein [Ignavibacteria bacterium]|nr:DNA alkylation repair protein [Ignavibacteria bacterium]MCU7503690.1 DNA alkylation repair protein [Ignavibacteria bacterium]MCU7517663.1 DNA alkylation repair protein [Ignavibacteria bacterium]
MTKDEVIEYIKSNYNEENVRGMARFGISPVNTFGVSMPMLRSLAKVIGKDHRLALELWETGIHEARILAALTDDPRLVTPPQMEKWVCDFESWDVCDQTCSNLFDKTPFAYRKAHEWSLRPEEFVKRAGFVLMAALAVHNKKADDEMFLEFLSVIEREACDERNFVKKAVNWALRQIGKRKLGLMAPAKKTAERILKLDSKSARWIARDALRELNDEKILARIKE